MEKLSIKKYLMCTTIAVLKTPLLDLDLLLIFCALNFRLRLTYSCDVVKSNSITICTACFVSTRCVFVHLLDLVFRNKFLLNSVKLANDSFYLNALCQHVSELYLMSASELASNLI